MRPHTIAVSIALGRTLFGAAMLVSPATVATWIGDDARRPAVRPISRAVGARDLALGLGALMAMRRKQPARGWVEAGMLCDLVDLGATLAAYRQLPRTGAFGAIASAVAVAGLGAYIAPRLSADVASDDEPALAEVLSD